MREVKLVPQEVLEYQKRIRQDLYEELHDQHLTYHIESYGCQMNDHDSEKLAAMLNEMGYTRAVDKDSCDLLLFNTCCVREHAEKRVFGNIGALKKKKEQNPAFIIGVCGCMTQQSKVAKRLFKRFPFVDLVVGTHSLHEFPELLSRVLHGERVCIIKEIDGEVAEGLPAERLNTYSTNVIIGYGCDNFCSYCIVPYVRGRERSRTPERILEETRALAKAGYKEITLLGQNVNSYFDAASGYDFPKLLRLLNDEVRELPRIRFMTSHPKDLSPDLIRAMAELDHVCDHIHLPVQSGSNRILQQMNRKYTREHYLSLVKALREALPTVEFTTDIIVGFPGETEEDFQDTVSLVKEVGYAAAFTFMYSPRSGTRAAEMPDQIPEEVKKRRLLELNAVQAELIRKGNDKYIGMEAEVLVEGCDDRTQPMAFGKMTNFRMVYFPGTADMIGQFKQVRITNVQNNSLIGELI